MLLEGIVPQVLHLNVFNRGYINDCFTYLYKTSLLYIGDAVVNVYINHEKKFAFVEMRTVEEASNAMALDGIMFEVCRLSFVLHFGKLTL